MTKDFEIHDVDWAKDLETLYEEYMDACFESVDADPEDEPFETLSGEPFCGCPTCHTRETLFFFTPRLLKAADEGKVTLA
ncbi:hypothetical protein UFOVP221_131 [uncultured Caudovirales phage]|uniref:Uncharacterized protein n=1 Tax=uncultured Caudovirales phage TaxID=2100421 RepID=A0A6J7WXG4_9CAUD|nr:hypothetical protein UFOVP221_131 [uncultured Caudovirales phage]